jgi:hypothetical protein
VSFLAPLAFALLALLPVIIAMYLLKLRRTEQEVSSVYLWRKMVRDLEANAPWQRLRRNLLLILQLLFLTALILALARPFTWAAGSSSQAAILILDTSASMSATDVSPSRLENAKEQARQVVDGLPDDARVTVMAAGEGAQVLAASSQDRRQIHQAIEQAQPGTGGSDLTTAMQLAAAIAARQPETEVVVLSDGNVTLPERLAIQGRVRYIPVGESGENLAISLFSLEAAAAGGGLTGFVQVNNYGEATAQRRLEIYTDGELANVHDLEIPPGEQRAVIAEDLPGETRVAEARLLGEDALSLDDRSWAAHRQTEATTISLVTEGNLFLETALTLLPNVEVTTITPSDFDASSNANRTETTANPDLTILDSHVPVTDSVLTGNVFFIAPPGSSGFFTVTGVIEEPALRPVSGSEALLKDIQLAEVSVLKATRIALPDWARTIIAGDVEGESAPLLFAGEVDGRRLAVLAFDLHHSDLPLQVAFPLMIANLVNWLAPGSGGNLPDQVTPGSPVAVNLPLDVETAVVRRPDGTSARYETQGGRLVYPDTNQLGVYRISWGQAEEATFAVNLFLPEESRVKPAGTLALFEASDGNEAEAQGQGRREWWRPLAFASLVLLLVEWLVYQRATIVHLMSGMREVLAR